MLASVEKRVRAWNDVQPFYSDAVYGAGKEVESRNAESVLNALFCELRSPQGSLSERTRLAFDNAWALQSRSGRMRARGFGRTSITRHGSRRNRSITGQR